MTTPLRRHCFQFSLAAMFVVVTVVAVPLGWLTMEWRFIQKRHEAIEWLQDQAGGIIPTEIINYGPTDKVPSVPLWRQWMGDEAYTYVFLPWPEPSKTERDRILRTFPEATIYKPNPHGAPTQ